MNLDIVKSAVLGLVVGDALGVPAEFMNREELTKSPIAEMRGYGTHSQPAGTWSDDSSMMLCLLKSLSKALDYQDIMSRFLRWAEQGYMTAHGEVFDMGISTRKALVKFSEGTPPLECGGTDIYDNGNGSLMRILPLSLWLHGSIGANRPYNGKAYQVIHNVSALTHAHPISLISCGIYCSAANELICGRNASSDIQNGIEAAKNYYRSLPEFSGYLHEFERVDAHILQSLPNENISSSGFVIHTLEAALWCLLRSNDYRSCLLEAVNLGEDTDTVGAVAGGLAGLKYGWQKIPSEWLNSIAKLDKILSLCEAFSVSI